jgi:hypothetical protein
VTKTLGAGEAVAWMRALDAANPPTHERWYAEIVMSLANERPPTDFDESIATRLHINIYSEEWGVYFCHRARSSWIRVTDIAFVHGRDDFELFRFVPTSLAQLGTFVRRIESTEGIRFERAHASIKTNIERAEPGIRRWLASL